MLLTFAVFRYVIKLFVFTIDLMCHFFAQYFTDKLYSHAIRVKLLQITRVASSQFQVTKAQAKLSPSWRHII